MTNRCIQLEKLRKLFERRADAAMVNVQNHQMQVKKGELKREQIMSCAHALQHKLALLDKARPIAYNISVEHLHAEAGARSIIERDLRKELFYLKTAEEDIVAANQRLLGSRAQWQAHQNRLDALVHLHADHQLNRDLLNVAKNASELDELALRSHRSGSHIANSYTQHSAGFNENKGGEHG